MFEDEIDDIKQLIPTSEPYIKDNSNNTLNAVPDIYGKTPDILALNLKNPNTKKIILLWPTDHVLMACSYTAGYVPGGNITVNLFINRPSELNKKFGIPQCVGHYKYPYKEGQIEMSEALAKYLIIGITDYIKDKSAKNQSY